VLPYDSLVLALGAEQGGRVANDRGATRSASLTLTWRRDAPPALIG
jgi:hypothetical protein